MFAAPALLKRPIRVDFPLFSRRSAQAPPQPYNPRAALIAQIIDLNPSATPSFLTAFSETALADYLAHLQLGSGPRDASSAWVRQKGAPAIVHRSSRDA